MPFADGNFDVVLCQQALMFFPDKVAALREMRRVLRWGGRIAVSVAGASPGVGVIAEILEDFAGKEAANVFLSAFALREPSDVTTLFDRAGFKSSNLQTVHRAGRYPSMEACLLTHVGSFLAGCIDVDAVLTTTRGSLEPFCTATGAVHIPMEVHITTASKD
jgi:SAM-dependent methyltransferase